MVMVMKTLRRTLFASALVALATATHAADEPAAEGKPVSMQINEARKEGQILGAYAINRHLSVFRLDAQVEDDEARLSGTVDSAVERELAEQIAMGVDGIDKVDNRIVIDPRWQVPGGRNGKDRSFGEVVNDTTTTASVKSKLLLNDQTDGSDIKVDTQAGVVTLDGITGSEAAKALAERLAFNTQGVRSVRNNLQVRGDGATPGTAATNLKVRHSATMLPIDGSDATASDAWITAKVKSTLALSKNVSERDIEVTTQDGVVHLAGAAGSGAERDLAVELAQNVRGVRQGDASSLRSGS